MNKKIYIIDHGLGNLQSIIQVFSYLNIKIEVTCDPDKIIHGDGIILPGVGAFAEAINNMNKSGMSHAVINFIQSGKPFMGVCLGLQLLFSESEEFGIHKGLSIIDGKVKALKLSEVKKIPQVGWNQIIPPKEDYTLLNDTALNFIRDDNFMYFNHSYYVEPNSNQVVLTETCYNGKIYCSSIIKENVFAVQFHPEKSGNAGILIYKSWVELI